MKKLTLSLLYLGLLTLSANSKECELIILPSDFQLDDQLKVPNESNMFSAIGNVIYIANIRGFTNGVFCKNITNQNIEKSRACIDELDQFLEKDSAKLNGSRISDVLIKNHTDGFKISGYAPISKEHLCSIQNKYKTNTSLYRSSFLPLLENKQAKIRKNYLEASKTIGQSMDSNEITNAIVLIENRE